MDTVMARARPMKRRLSKNSTSPMAMASTMETTSSRKLASTREVSRPMPPVSNTQRRRTPPPRIARMALAVTELRGGDTVRMSRLVTAHVRPDPSAQSAPRAGREKRSTGAVTIPDAAECAKVMNPMIDEPVPAPDPVLLEQIQRRVLWLSTLMVHHANSRPNPDGTKAGGHQASSASVVSLMTALYFEELR